MKNKSNFKFWSILSLEILAIVFLIFSLIFSSINFKRGGEVSDGGEEQKSKPDFCKETGSFSYLDKVYTKKTDLGDTSLEHWVDMGHFNLVNSGSIVNQEGTYDYLEIKSFAKWNWSNLTGRDHSSFVTNGSYNTPLILQNFFKLYGISEPNEIYFLFRNNSNGLSNPYGIKDVQVFGVYASDYGHSLGGIRFYG